jgi:hypothetical protein
MLERLFGDTVDPDGTPPSMVRNVSMFLVIDFAIICYIELQMA